MWYAAQIPLSLDPTSGSVRRWPARSAARGWCTTTGCGLREDAHRAGLPFLSDGELSRQVVTVAKRTPERAWLGEVSAVALQQSLADLDRAYRNYFRDLKRVKAARARGEQREAAGSQASVQVPPS